MDVPVVTTEQLARLARTGDVAVIDVRSERQVRESGLKIRGSVLEDRSAVREWAPRYDKTRPLVLVCA